MYETFNNPKQIVEIGSSAEAPLGISKSPNCERHGDRHSRFKSDPPVHRVYPLKEDRGTGRKPFKSSVLIHNTMKLFVVNQLGYVTRRAVG